MKPKIKNRRKKIAATRSSPPLAMLEPATQLVEHEHHEEEQELSSDDAGVGTMEIASGDEEEDTSGIPSTGASTSAESTEATLINPGRRPAIKILLSEPQEDDLVDWFRENSVFYNKGLRDYKDANHKAQLLERKAATIVPPITGTQLKTWIDSMRTRYTCLTDRKSGSATPRHTARDKWVLGSFSFLKEHIVRHAGRSSIQDRASARVDEVAVVDDDSEEPRGQGVAVVQDEGVGESAVGLPPRQKRAKLTAAQSAEETNLLLEQIRVKTQQSDVFMKAVQNQVKPQTIRESKMSTFLAFLGTQFEDVSDTHLRGAQSAVLQVVHRFADASKATQPAPTIQLPTTQNPPPQQQQQQQQFQQPQYTQAMHVTSGDTQFPFTVLSTPSPVSRIATSIQDLTPTTSARILDNLM